MKISLNWLGGSVEWIERDHNVIADRITRSVGEVERIEIQGELLLATCIGKVQSVRKHPNADTLFLCDVQTDRGMKSVVCGGTNLRAGMHVAFAHTGARVKWHGGEVQTLTSVKIRGETSEGMICAAEELGLEGIVGVTEAQGVRPIVDFKDGDDGVGTPLREYLGLDDVILHVDNHAITHRADLFSQIGFARECVALGLARWKRAPRMPSFRFPNSTVPFRFIIDEKRLMPRYLACVIGIDALGETPQWMQKRLRSVGWRPVNLPVDITNYVATEVGVPLHSFDIADLRGDVHMRISRADETIITLDGKERVLPSGALVLSDDEGIFDLLGIMGGLRSSTKNETRRIYLHSASLDPVSIRRTVIATGHRTDAATVYEKGVPHITAEFGFHRALELFLDLVPGAKIASKLEEWGDNGKAKPIPFSLDRVQRILGADVPAKSMKKILMDLEFRVRTAKGGKIAAIAPLHRLGDIKTAHDLIEEIGRVHGYDAIIDSPPAAPTAPPARETRLHAIRDALKEQGMLELTPLSLLGSDLLSKSAQDVRGVTALANPIGEELGIMQPSLLPRLLEHAEGNLLHTDDALRTFSIATVFRDEREWTEMAMLITEKRQSGIRSDPFLLVKQSLTAALAGAGYALSVAPAENVPAFAHPGRCASVETKNGVRIGLLFEVHPSVRANFDLPARASACIVDLTILLKIEPLERHAAALPAYPAVVYDTTAICLPTKSVGALTDAVRRTCKLLETIDIVDLYSGRNLPKNSYAITFRCTYRANDRTLTEEEAKREHTKVERIILKTA